MRSKFTTLKWVISLTILWLISPSVIRAQTYCSPTFAYGCSSWNNQTITLDSINWVLDGYYCEIYDYTSMSTTLNAGSSYTMDVTNGDWCGCGVWIDFNQDYVFDTTENLFYSYVANETNYYNFLLDIPANVPTGAYRMRVVAGWGTDCYTASSNGYGPCGSYQYGNFDDFTVNIIGVSASISYELDAVNSLSVFPNPATSEVTVALAHDSGNGIVQLTNLNGQLIQSHQLTEGTELIDVSNLPSGIYLLHYSDAMRRQSTKLVKE